MSKSLINNQQSLVCYLRHQRKIMDFGARNLHVAKRVLASLNSCCMCSNTYK